MVAIKLRNFKKKEVAIMSGELFFFRALHTYAEKTAYEHKVDSIWLI
jgi:hypothetical protein